MADNHFDKEVWKLHFDQIKHLFKDKPLELATAFGGSLAITWLTETYGARAVLTGAGYTVGAMAVLGLGVVGFRYARAYLGGEKVVFLADRERRFLQSLVSTVCGAVAFVALKIKKPAWAITAVILSHLAVTALEPAHPPSPPAFTVAYQAVPYRAGSEHQKVRFSYKDGFTAQATINQQFIMPRRDDDEDAVTPV